MKKPKIFEQINLLRLAPAPSLLPTPFSTKKESIIIKNIRVILSDLKCFESNLDYKSI